MPTNTVQPIFVKVDKDLKETVEQFEDTVPIVYHAS